MQLTKGQLGRNARSERVPNLEPCVIRFGSPHSTHSFSNEEIVASAREGVLSILYNSEKALPDFVSNSKCSMVFEGWLENRDALLEELDIQIAKDAGDIDVVFKAYLQVGESIFSRLHGAFQMVILDHARNTLLCVRDRFGTFPVFFTDTGTELLICTYVDTLIRHPRVSGKINRVVAAEHLSNRWLKLDETYYEKINRVPPAHLLRVHNGTKKVERYWDPFPTGIPTEWAGEEALHKFDETFERAVARRMEAGKTAIFLSGGLDSVSIASVASSLSTVNGEGTYPLAMSLIFPHPGCDESEIQSSVATQLNLGKYLLPFENVYHEEGLLYTALQISRDWPLPTLTPWKPGYFKLSEEAYARGYRSILSGDGGDEWLTVHPNYLADLLRDFRFIKLYRVLMSFMRSHGLSQKQMLRFLLWNSGGRTLLRAYMAAAAPNMMRTRRQKTVRENTRPWVSSDPQLRQQIYERLDEYVEESLVNPLPAKHYGFYFGAFPHMVIRTLSSMGMEESFEIGRRTGVWLLKPYYDSELVDLLLRVPPALLQRGGREKGVVRQTVARRFPGLKFEKQRKVSAIGFLQQILKKDGLKEWKRLGGAKTLVELGIVEPKAVDAAISRSFTSSDPRAVNVVWELLNLESWVRPRV